jgi:hypothetical protein
VNEALQGRREGERTGRGKEGKKEGELSLLLPVLSPSLLPWRALFTGYLVLFSSSDSNMASFTFSFVSSKLLCFCHLPSCILTSVFRYSGSEKYFSVPCIAMQEFVLKFVLKFVFIFPGICVFIVCSFVVLAFIMAFSLSSRTNPFQKSL